MKINRLTKRQLSGVLNQANKIVDKYLGIKNMDNMFFTKLVKETNDIYEKNKQDCFTQKIMIAICEYFEELEKEEREPKGFIISK